MLHWKKAITSVILFGIVVGLFLVIRTPPAASFDTSLPNPNGYTVLMRAADALDPNGVDVSTLEGETLAKWVADHRALYEGIRQGLALPSKAIVWDVPIGQQLPGLAGGKSLARALIAEGRMWEFKGQPAAAARSYLDVIKLGSAVAQGGLLVHNLVGYACVAQGLKGLESVERSVPAAEAREISLELTRLSKTFASADEVRQLEEAVFVKRAKLAERLAYRIQWMLPKSGLKAAVASFAAKSAQNTRALRQAAEVFAARAGAAEKAQEK